MLDRLRITYLPLEDRLEVCIVAKAPAKMHRLHLTRRLTRHWLDQIGRVLEASAAAPAAAEPATRAALTGLHHETVAAKAKFTRSSSDSADADLERNVAPALVTEINCGHLRKEQRWVLRFGFGAGESVSLNLTPETLHGAIELLGRQLKTTDWQLSLPLAEAVRGPIVDQALH